MDDSERTEDDDLVEGKLGSARILFHDPVQVQANSEMDDSEWTWDDPTGDDSVEQHPVYSEPGAG